MTIETSQSTGAPEPKSKGTEVGNYFVSNYPPFSQWTPEGVGEAMRALDAAPRPEDPLGLYIHIPFCRKRCKFCYYKVYTDKNSTQIEDYLAGLVKEMEILSRKRAIEGRTLRFAYFGGGTPSYLSEKQLTRLVEGLDRSVSWAKAEEVTFECEPGTLRESKLRAIRDIGVTRLSLGVEHFDDKILEWNGRAHLSPEIYRAWDWIRAVDFPQVNIDLIAGMMGETEETWVETVRRAVELEPDSVTIYQMELPYNTVISREILDKGIESPIADWETKRRWVEYAFGEFEARGYELITAYTAATKKKKCKFIYTDALWHGTDMAAIGVSSFGHFDGVHYQNYHNYAEYLEPLARGELPIYRAMRLSDKQRLIREMILQLKTGRIELDYFKGKFGADVMKDFGDAYRSLAAEKLLERRNGSVVLSREGLLRVDSFLPTFFEPEFRNVRVA